MQKKHKTYSIERVPFKHTQKLATNTAKKTSTLIYWYK